MRRLAVIAACVVLVALGGYGLAVGPRRPPPATASSVSAASSAPSSAAPASPPPATAPPTPRTLPSPSVSAASSAPPSTAPASSGADVSPGTAEQPAIVAENLETGSSGWRIGRGGYRIADDVGLQVKGYASATSVESGEQITFFASVRPVQALKLDIYRLGWYGGKGGRIMLGGAWLPGLAQPACPIDWMIGLRVCDWQPTLRLTIPTTWVSGLYLAVLTNSDHFQNGIPFVVRADASRAPLLYVQPVTTYQAYNQFPNDGVGQSLYENAVKVSFDRPYANDGVSKLFSFDQPFAAWVERAGYDVTYATSIDLDEQGAALLLRHRAMITAGHDEYWTAAMRTAATTARDKGVSLAFFSANNVYWQARLEATTDGRPDRVLVCYRSATLDPEPSAGLKTVRWREPPVSQPEQSLLGAQYTNKVAGRARWVVSDADNWVYHGTGLSNGQQIAGLVLGESDRPDLPHPPVSAPAVAILSDSPFRTSYRSTDRSKATLYQAHSGAWVFDAATFGWPGALNPLARPDPRVERMTANLLDRMISGSAPRALRLLAARDVIGRS